MEAEGDSLEPFDPGNLPDNMGDETPDPRESGNFSNDNENLDGPPPISDNNDVLSFMGNGEEDPNNEDQEDNNEEDEKLSDKANNILNQKLYQKILNRNEEIEDIINNYQSIVSAIPFEIVKSNDISLSRLKKALSKGKDYVINKFVDSKYGENLLFYEKLNSLYALLLNDIDANLKKVNK